MPDYVDSTISLHRPLPFRDYNELEANVSLLKKKPPDKNKWSNLGFYVPFDPLFCNANPFSISTITRSSVSFSRAALMAASYFSVPLLLRDRGSGVQITVRTSSVMT